MRQATDTDAALLELGDASRPGHVGVLGVYGPGLTRSSLIATLEDRLHLAPWSRRTVVGTPLGLDRPYLVEDPAFQISRHVALAAIEQPADWAALCRTVARVHGERLDPQRPLWRATLIEGLGPSACFPAGSVALLLTMHVATLDPLSGADLITAIHDRSPDAEPVPPRRRWHPDPQPPGYALLARAGVTLLRRPVRTVRELPPLRAAAQLVKDQLPRLRGELAPSTRFDADLTGDVAFGATSLTREQLRTIRGTVAGSSTNDAVLSVVAGALRSYLIHSGDVPRDLVALSPFAARQSSESASTEDLVSITRIRLRADVEDPVSRLAATAASTRLSPDLQAPPRGRYLAHLAEVEPGRWFGVAARRLARFSASRPTRRSANLVILNTPGPAVQLYLAGVPLLGSFTVGPQLEGIGLTIGVSSYLDRITVAVTAARAVLPDPEILIECLGRAVREAVDVAVP